MTVILHARKLLFVSAPKVACSSVKNALFKVENGFEFKPFFANGIFRHIHDRMVYPAIPFDAIPRKSVEEYFKVTLVRDPVKRFLSAYSNRVVHYKELSESHIGQSARAAGLTPDPDLSQFVKNIQGYRKISRSIKLHTDPLHVFLGRNPAFYSRIFDIKETQRLEEELSGFLATDVSLPHLQAGGPKIEVDALSDPEREILKNFYAEDYRIFGAYFSIDDS